jgi:hypothetical protein
MWNTNGTSSSQISLYQVRQGAVTKRKVLPPLWCGRQASRETKANRARRKTKNNGTIRYAVFLQIPDSRELL